MVIWTLEHRLRSYYSVYFVCLDSRTHFHTYHQNWFNTAMHMYAYNHLICFDSSSEYTYWRNSKTHRGTFSCRSFHQCADVHSSMVLKMLSMCSTSRTKDAWRSNCKLCGSAYTFAVCIRLLESVCVCECECWVNMLLWNRLSAHIATMKRLKRDTVISKLHCQTHTFIHTNTIKWPTNWM